MSEDGIVNINRFKLFRQKGVTPPDERNSDDGVVSIKQNLIGNRIGDVYGLRFNMCMCYLSVYISSLSMFIIAIWLFQVEQLMLHQYLLQIKIKISLNFSFTTPINIQFNLLYRPTSRALDPIN